jgi:hypothetical protein
LCDQIIWSGQILRAFEKGFVEVFEMFLRFVRRLPSLTFYKGFKAVEPFRGFWRERLVTKDTRRIAIRYWKPFLWVSFCLGEPASNIP